ncbi:MFS transporter [Micromonospora sp. NPDC049204]|uniref:MFS transporter n=1 Tax=Micromonospora sp. NPDC049204 TaxID=3154351 RepID=UPI0034072FC2
MTTAAPAATRSRWILATICLTQLMIVLDSTIVSIALPSVQDALQMSDGARQWVITAYALPFGALLLAGGRISGIVGHPRALVWGLAGFAVASTLAGSAPNAPALIAGRALQGCCAALLAPAALALLSTIFAEGRERGRAFGAFAAVSAAGSAIGLIAGGLLTEYAGWRWCLFINLVIVPIGLFGARALPRGERLTGGRFPAATEVLLSVASVVTVVAGFSAGASHGWADPYTLILLLAGGALLAAFVVVERRSRDPLVPPRIVAHRRRGGALLTVFLLQLALFGCYLFMTYFTQTVLGYSPVRAGLVLVVTSVGAVAGAVVAGLLHGRVSTRVITVPGLLALGAGILILSRARTDTPDVFLLYLLPAQILAGMGLGSVLTPLTSEVTAGTDSAGSGVASGLYNAVQQVGAAVGTALFNTVATSTTAGLLIGSGTDAPTRNEATVTGYATALIVAAGVVLGAAVVAWTIGRPDHRSQGT